MCGVGFEGVWGRGGGDAGFGWASERGAERGLGILAGWMETCSPTKPNMFITRYIAAGTNMTREFRTKKIYLRWGWGGGLGGRGGGDRGNMG